MDICQGTDSNADMVAHFAFEGALPKLGGSDGKIVAMALKSGEFTGQVSTQLLIRKENVKLLLLGIGKREEFSTDIIRAASARATSLAHDLFCRRAYFAPSILAQKECGGAEEYATAVAEGALLSSYRFDKYKSKEKGGKKKGEVAKITIGSDSAAACAKGIAYAKAVCDANAFARDIANESGKDGLPGAIAEKARNMARKNGISFRSLSRKECEKMGMGAYLSVAAGSPHEPEFLVLEWKGKKPRGTVCLVGKGVTFDTGGISLKSGKDMDKMKHDKCGAAAVLGAMLGASRLRLPMRVIGITPLVENMPDGESTKPGDIVKASNGKTIEVQNTDAEGRMVLADALCYAQKFKPDATIDLATLTGACVVALGSHAAGLLSHNDNLARAIETAGSTTHERVWRLPLWREYADAMKGEFSDLKNISGDGEAGTITAASFLTNFTGGMKYAHIDIAGTSYSYKMKMPFTQAGANGFGVRLLCRLLADWKMATRKGKKS